MKTIKNFNYTSTPQSNIINSDGYGGYFESQFMLDLKDCLDEGGYLVGRSGCLPRKYGVPIEQVLKDDYGFSVLITPGTIAYIVNSNAGDIISTDNSPIITDYYLYNSPTICIPFDVDGEPIFDGEDGYTYVIEYDSNGKLPQESYNYRHNLGAIGVYIFYALMDDTN